MGIATLTALVLLLVPHAAASDAKTDVAGGNIDIASTLYKLKNPGWEDAVSKRLARRDEQIAQEAREREAKRAEEEAARVATVQPQQVQTTQAGHSGGHEDWLRAAGIPEEVWGYVDFIVTRESGWNPNAVNRSSGACGLGQQLPCGKWAGAWNDPVAALVAMNGYVARYGGWAGAVAFWQSHNWY